MCIQARGGRASQLHNYWQCQKPALFRGTRRSKRTGKSKGHVASNLEC